MTEKAFRQLNIDPEFKNLIRPLRREEYRQLELNLVMEGCREDIIAWNDPLDLCEPTWAPQHLRRNQEISDWETI